MGNWKRLYKLIKELSNTVRNLLKGLKYFRSTLHKKSQKRQKNKNPKHKNLQNNKNKRSKLRINHQNNNPNHLLFTYKSIIRVNQVFLAYQILEIHASLIPLSNASMQHKFIIYFILVFNQIQINNSEKLVRLLFFFENFQLIKKNMSPQKGCLDGSVKAKGFINKWTSKMPSNCQESC